MFVYADHGATTSLSKKAMEAMVSCMENISGNPSSLHEEGRKARSCLEKARRTMALCLDCSPRELYFTSGGTESDNLAILTAAELGAKQGKRHIVTTAFEHPAVGNALKKLEKQGFQVTWLPISRENHNLSPEQVEKAIREDTCLVTIMYANNEVGSILPIREIGAICRRKGVLFHVDGVQAVGQIPVSVEKDHIDFLSLSAHKFHGPKGVGALCARKGLELSRLWEGGGQERGKRPGTENLPGICGMAAALEEACSSLEETQKTVREMREKLIRGLSRIPGSSLNGDSVNRLPGNVNFCFQGVEGESLLVLLDMEGVCASSGSACSSGSLEPSPVLLALGRTPQEARSGLRLTLGRDNTMEEVDYLLKVVPETVEKLRGQP